MKEVIYQDSDEDDEFRLVTIEEICLKHWGDPEFLTFKGLPVVSEDEEY